MLNAPAIPSIPSNSVTMTSREISVLTGKELAHVHRDIKSMMDDLIKDDPKVDYPDLERDSRGYIIVIHLNRELTDTLLTGYSAVARNKVIKRWHELEGKPAKQLSAMEMVILSAQSILSLEKKQAETDARMLALESKTSAVLDQSGYFSVLGYANMKGLKLDLKAASALGKKAAKESKLHGVMQGEIPDPRFGRVKTYHSDILDIVFN